MTNPSFTLGAGGFFYAVSGLLTHNKLNNHFWIYQSLQFSSNGNILSKIMPKKIVCLILTTAICLCLVPNLPYLEFLCL